MASRLLYAAACLLLLAAPALPLPPIIFHVGGPRGWAVPVGNETETYNQWATRNRFHIGDYLYFKYANDSVLVVSREDYDLCSAARPLVRFADGETSFRFDRHGFFYFISGEPGHCEAGQRLVVRVMVHTGPGVGPAPAPAPAGSAPAGGSGRSGPGSGSGSSPRPGEATGAASGRGIGGYSLGGAVVAALSVLVLV